MNRIRELFRHRSTSRNRGGGKKAGHGGNRAGSPRRHRRSPNMTPGTNATTTAGAAAGAATTTTTTIAPASPHHVSSPVRTSSSLASGTALDHLYESYRDNVAAADRKSRSKARRPCMVLREYNESYYAPAASTTSSVFLPAQYHMLSEDDVREMGSGSLPGSMALAGPGDSRRAIMSATESSLSRRTLSTAVPLGSKAATATSLKGADRHAPTSGYRRGATEGLYSENTDAEVEDEVMGIKLLTTTTTVTPLPQRDKRSTASWATGTGAVAANTTAVPPTDLERKESVPMPPPPSAALHKDTLPGLPNSDDIRQRVRCVVPPQSQPLTRAEADGRQLRSVGGGGGGVEAGPAEVEVVRLNAEYYSAAELARWYQYQISRLGSFIAPGDRQRRTSSQSTQSRDAPSANSEGSLEFVLVKRGSGSRAPSEDEHDCEDAQEAMELGVQRVPSHLVRVLYPGAVLKNADTQSSCASSASSLTDDFDVEDVDGDDAQLEAISAVERSKTSSSRSSSSGGSSSTSDSFDSDYNTVGSYRSGSRCGRGRRGRTRYSGGRGEVEHLQPPTPQPQQQPELRRLSAIHQQPRR